MQVLQYLAHNLDNTLQDNRYSNRERAKLVYEVTLVWLRHFFLEEEGPLQKQLGQMEHLIDRLFDCVHRERAYTGFILNLRRYDNRVYTHCLNVCLIGLAFAHYLGWRAAEIQAFGLGALVHDLGMIKVPKAILQKTLPLTPQEFALIKLHPITGTQMLQNFTLRRESLLMVQQHHENGDGSGYPKGLQLTAIHPWARILRILDSYEAMTSRRPWRAARPLKETLWTMRQDWEKTQMYDPGYLTPFIKFLAGL
jgi:HD-GYP domain-containing protein (c-di-GMP phosphodiesterase class II)